MSRQQGLKGTPTEILSGRNQPQSLSLDWIGRRLFWVEPVRHNQTRTCEMCTGDMYMYMYITCMYIFICNTVNWLSNYMYMYVHVSKHDCLFCTYVQRTCMYMYMYDAVIFSYTPSPFSLSLSLFFSTLPPFFPSFSPAFPLSSFPSLLSPSLLLSLPFFFYLSPL